MKIYCLVALLGLAFATPVHAETIDFRVIERSKLASGNTTQYGYWTGLQIDYQPSDKYYLFGSIEQASVYPGAYHAFDVQFKGLGVGTKISLHKNIRLFFQVAINQISNSWGGRRPRESEAIQYFLNAQFHGLPDPHRLPDDPAFLEFDAYSVKYSPFALSGSIGIESFFPINKSWFWGTTFSYRTIKFDRKIAGYRTEWDALPGDQWWVDSATQQAASYNLGAFMTKRFNP